jgi:hypothetical protein
MKNETIQTMGAIVDRLGALKALAANLADESEILKGELILAGVPAIDGGLFRATVSHCPGRDTTDWKALALALGATDDLVTAYTTTGTPFTTVRLTARKGA